MKPGSMKSNHIRTMVPLLGTSYTTINNYLLSINHLTLSTTGKTTHSLKNILLP